MAQKYVILKKQVEELKEVTVPKKARYCKGLHMCGSNVKAPPFDICKIKLVPADIYRGRGPGAFPKKTQLKTRYDIIYEPATEQEQIEGMRGLYERVVYPKKHMRERWPTFEAWLAHERKWHEELREKRVNAEG